MTLAEAKALIAKVDAAERAGVEMNEETMLKLGYIKTEDGIWELPIPLEIARQLSSEPIVVTDENVEEIEDRFHAMNPSDPQFKLLGYALHKYMIG